MLSIPTLGRYAAALGFGSVLLADGAHAQSPTGKKHTSAATKIMFCIQQKAEPLQASRLMAQTSPSMESMSRTVSTSTMPPVI